MQIIKKLVNLNIGFILIYGLLAPKLSLNGISRSKYSLFLLISAYSHVEIGQHGVNICLSITIGSLCYVSFFFSGMDCIRT